MIKIKKLILICALILLTCIGAVNAMEDNITDDSVGAENSTGDLKATNDEETLNAVVENESEVISSSSPPSDVPIGVPVISHKLKLDKSSVLDDIMTKELVFGKVKMLKKDFNRFVKNTPSKHNKELWKEYKKFNKKISKKLKKSIKKTTTKIEKKWEIDWYYGIRPVFVVKGKYCTMYWVCMCYKWI